MSARILYCAFADVPGPSSTSTRMQQWLHAFGGPHVDALSLKLKNRAALVGRFSGARMLRVPIGNRAPFLERLAAYQRALERQLAAEPYDLVWCGDFFSAAVATHFGVGNGDGGSGKSGSSDGGGFVIADVAGVPSMRVAELVEHAHENSSVRRRWRERERATMRAATRILVPSKVAQKQLVLSDSGDVDAGAVVVMPRAVDLRVFKPPSIEIEMSDTRRVVIFGGRESRLRADVAIACAGAILERVIAETRIAIVGMPSSPSADRHLARSFARGGERASDSERVSIVDADDAAAVEQALSGADVVIVPTSAETGLDCHALPHRALEAMACGRAVVVTGKEASFRDAGKHGEHFAVAPAHDPGAVASVTLQLLEDDDMRRALAKRALRWIAENADLAARGDDIARLVQDTTGIVLRELTAPTKAPPAPAADAARQGTREQAGATATDIAWLPSAELRSVDGDGDDGGGGGGGGDGGSDSDVFRDSVGKTVLDRSRSGAHARAPGASSGDSKETTAPRRDAARTPSTSERTPRRQRTPPPSSPLSSVEPAAPSPAIHPRPDLFKRIAHDTIVGGVDGLDEIREQLDDSTGTVADVSPFAGGTELSDVPEVGVTTTPRDERTSVEKRRSGSSTSAEDQ